MKCPIHPRLPCCAPLLVAALAIAFSWSALAFNPGDRIEVNWTVHVRAEPAGHILGEQQSGSRGTVLAGPVERTLDGTLYRWFQVDFDTESSGWCAEEWLGIGLPGQMAYLRQIGISDMDPSFNSDSACGPISAVMILTYYNRLTPRPILTAHGEYSDYGWYVAPVDEHGIPSPTAYQYANFTFDIGTRDSVDPNATVHYDAFGYLTQLHQSDPLAEAGHAAEYLWKHGVWAELGGDQIAYNRDGCLYRLTRNSTRIS